MGTHLKSRYKHQTAVSRACIAQVHTRGPIDTPNSASPRACIVVATPDGAPGTPYPAREVTTKGQTLEGLHASYAPTRSVVRRSHAGHHNGRAVYNTTAAVDFRIDARSITKIT